MNTKASLDQMYRADPNVLSQNQEAPHSLATNSMLQHYANRMQQKYQKWFFYVQYVVKALGFCDLEAFTEKYQDLDEGNPNNGSIK